MDKLYPIIRRKRRPLIVADMPPVAAEPVQPVAAKPLVESPPVAPAPESGPDGPSEKPKATDAKPAPQDESY
jgi:hypothetical protein